MAFKVSDASRTTLEHKTLESNKSVAFFVLDMQAVTVTMGTGNRATDLHSSQPPTGRVACAESPAGLRAHGDTRGVRGLSCMPMGGGQRRGGVVQQRHPNLRALNSVGPDACSTCTGLECLPADLC